jgi:hypothetical protein
MFDFALDTATIKAVVTLLIFRRWPKPGDFSSSGRRLIPNSGRENL